MLNPIDLKANKKAFEINMSKTIYGTFAEIGAGQEVARRFFHVGGAAGTVAKTISAYDMTFSDAIYGKSTRFVSRQRLGEMLDHEYDLLIERLDEKVGAERTFFAFADTVAARSYKTLNESHGWMGIRFQSHPRTQPNEIIMHVRMLDEENLEQQEALGIVGLNLIHGAYFLRRDPKAFISSLLDDLDSSRIEIDMIRFSGPDFAMLDNRIMPRARDPGAGPGGTFPWRLRGHPGGRHLLPQASPRGARELPSGHQRCLRHADLCPCDVPHRGKPCR